MKTSVSLVLFLPLLLFCEVNHQNESRKKEQVRLVKDPKPRTPSQSAEKNPVGKHASQLAGNRTVKMHCSSLSVH